MDQLFGFITFVALVLLVLVLVLPVVAMARARRALEKTAALESRVTGLEREIRLLRRGGATPVETGTRVEEPPPLLPRTFAPPPVTRPVPPVPAAKAEPPPEPAAQPVQSPWTTGKFAAHRAEPAKAAQERPESRDDTAIDWEELMGAKLFAWIGGLALFLGIGFFVKYSFDHNLIPPAARVAIGFLAGVGLLTGGLLMKRKEDAITAQTLSATGIVVLYSVTFACRSYYHFPLFGPVVTFVIMALVTLLAFLLSVQMDAPVIAVLGVAGGFLTPVLLSTGQDNPLALFGYIALLDCGLLAIAHRKEWRILPALGALGTIFTEAGWLASFFVPEYYYGGNKVILAMAVLAGFHGLFLAAVALTSRKDETNHSPVVEALVLGVVALLGAFYFLSFPQLGSRPILLCSYLFLVDLGLVALSLAAKGMAPVRTVAGLAVFAFLAFWTESYLNNANLIAALGCYLIFALFQTALPLVLQRLQKTAPPAWAQLFPALTMLLVMVPIFEFHQITILIWPFVLLIDLLAFVAAVATMALAPVLVMIVLTLVAIGGSLLQVDLNLTGLPTDLLLLGVFSIFFVTASSWTARKLAPKDARNPELFGSMHNPANLAVQLPALSAAMPLLLIVMVILRLPLRDPSPVFGSALLLVLLLLGLAKVMRIEALPVVGLVCALWVEHAWLASPLYSAQSASLLAWQLTFYGLFTVFPFLFKKQFAGVKAPWTASALAGPLHFYLVYEVVKMTYPAMPPGLLPALFALPALGGLAIIERNHTAENPARNTQLALFGGAALFFITLVFPLQLHREWLTISWALEGVALCWLFRRVPHRGLRLTGVLLLTVAFARLGLNPLLLGYHDRAAMPFLNWYLYAFGVTSLALFAGARLLDRPQNLIGEFSAQALLYTLGTILLFLLVNIEIADYFTAPGTPVLTFEFSGNFARDMSYSIAWAAFSLLLLIAGIWRRNTAVRYASLGLLGVTVLKLFLHDLSQLDQLYRIGAFIAVAVIAIFASFLYQRFLAFPSHGPAPAKT